MPIKSSNFILTKGYPAAAAITKKKAVKFTGDGSQSVTPITAVGDIVCGVAQFSVSATEITKGKKATVITNGRAVMTGALAISEGAVVYIDNTGQATTVATSATRIGICDEPCAGAGLDCSVSLD